MQLDSVFEGGEFEGIVRLSEPLCRHTWFRMGGPAEYFAEPNDTQQLAALVRRCHEEEISIRLLGGGANILVRESGVSGVVINLAAPAFTKIATAGSKIIAGGGVKLGHLISTSVREGLAGLETLVGIPGTVGGALHCNAGTRGGDIGQWTTRATVMTRAGELLERTGEELVFAYRQSSLDELVIVEAEFSLEPGDAVELTKRMQKQWIIKKSEQPLIHQNAGCVFKNPRGMSAGMLIDQAGLKGTRIGGAEVSERHANFVVADSTATSEDILNLIELMRSTIRDRSGIELEMEIEVW